MAPAAQRVRRHSFRHPSLRVWRALSRAAPSLYHLLSFYGQCVTRLALASILTFSNLPAAVILDDALVNTDEESIERINSFCGVPSKTSGSHPDLQGARLRLDRGQARPHPVMGLLPTGHNGSLPLWPIGAVGLRHLCSLDGRPAQISVLAHDKGSESGLRFFAPGRWQALFPAQACSP
jgi:hypothetical protein